MKADMVDSQLQLLEAPGVGETDVVPIDSGRAKGIVLADVEEIVREIVGVKFSPPSPCISGRVSTWRFRRWISEYDDYKLLSIYVIICLRQLGAMFVYSVMFIRWRDT